MLDYVIFHILHSSTFFHGKSVAIMDPKQYSSRQKPTSCRFCRSRKLRCNRESPCSNCVSRGLRCKLDSTARLATGTVASDPELLQRIRRLEQIVDSPKGAPTQSPKQPSESSDPQSIYGSAMSSEIENLDSDIAFLQDLYTSQDLSVKLLYLTCFTS
jgi:hypothetical protein